MSRTQTLGPRGLSEAALAYWGERIGAQADPPLWISMIGPLGAGKSVLARAICRGAGIGGPIPSPSFTLVQRYESPRGFPIFHVDLFRLSPGETMEPLGWDELLGADGFVLLEWANRAEGQQPGDRWEITIDFGAEVDERTVRARSLGSAPGVIEW